jgi:hypothetical protein
MVRRIKSGFLVAAALVLGASLVVPAAVYAEGTHQVNEMQELSASTDIYADILNAGETLNISLCADTFIRIYDTMGTPADHDDDTIVVDDDEFTANLDCEAPLPNPILNAYKFTPENTGVYRVELNPNDSLYRYDFTVTSNNTTDPNPTNNGGRIWSYMWRFSATEIDSEDGYPEETSTDADFYALVPAPVEGESFVWKLDLNNFAGGSYRLMANNIGLDAPYSGVSASEEGTDATVTPMYPIYLGFPDIAGDSNTTTPVISAQTFAADNYNKKGTFEFNSNSDNATYAITIDTNKDGVYGTGDRVLIGDAQAGLNTIEWDGKYADGETVTNGSYNARIQLRIGEFHFVARDVEASGGTHDGNSWADGLTIYKAVDADTTQNTTVFWDDLTALRIYNDETDEFNLIHDDATSNLPNGVLSGSMIDADDDGKADGFHTWGDFNGGGMGDDTLIDTYTYGGSDTEILPITVSWNGDTDADNVSNDVENGAPNNGDGNDDDIPDSQQQNVTSLVNPVTNSYSTIMIEGDCESLSNVSVVSEGSLIQRDGAYDYPLGMFDFDAICTTPGGTSTVTMFYDKVYDTTEWQTRKFINGVYGSIEGAVFGTADINGTIVTTVSYELTDGGELDADGEENGVIVDPAGPAAVALATIPVPGAPNTGLAQQNVAGYIAAAVVGLGILTLLVNPIRKKVFSVAKRK